MRRTITIDDNVYAKIQEIRGKRLCETGRDYSFTKCINDYLKKGLEVDDQIDFWIDRVTNIGASANAMCRFMIDRDKKPVAYPQDNDDWYRCYRTIQIIPREDWLKKLLELPNYKGWEKYRRLMMSAVQHRIEELKEHERV